MSAMKPARLGAANAMDSIDDVSGSAKALRQKQSEVLANGSGESMEGGEWEQVPVSNGIVPFHKDFSPSGEQLGTPPISSWVITTHCRLYSSISQIKKNANIFCCSLRPGMGVQIWKKLIMGVDMWYCTWWKTSRKLILKMCFCDSLVSLTLSKSKMDAKYRQYTG